VRSLSGLLEYHYNQIPLACMLFAFIDNFLFISNLCWALCLSVTIYQIIVLEETCFEKHLKWWILVSYPLAGSIQALPFSTRSYVSKQGSCQISINKTGNIWRFSSFYAPCFLISSIVIWLFVKVYQKVQVLESIKMKNVIFDRGFVYIYIILAVLIPFLIVRIFQIFYKDCILDFFVMVMFNMNILQGFFNSLVFFSNGGFRKFVKKTIIRCSEANVSIATLRISYASN
jgi:hypothetical protein